MWNARKMELVVGIGYGIRRVETAIYGIGKFTNSWLEGF